MRITAGESLPVKDLRSDWAFYLWFLERYRNHPPAYLTLGEMPVRVHEIWLLLDDAMAGNGSSRGTFSLEG